ncbi:cation/calcium exchanger 1-like [Salvia miltiorrhiza]|uniref:cation/calcium exchanger 1-like n=1 Tax=Salvia miltiorrhiza TaxID=226208 RepID=UPI0025AD7765|nr:cation/calcium exchanger 1-like [Salvia miltiorrhiza]
MDFFRNKALSLSISFSFSLFVSLYIFAVSPTAQSNNSALLLFSATDDCSGVREIADYRAKCAYVRSSSGCSNGYLNYLDIFYCACGDSPVLGYFLLLLWLVVLFYVLGNTTAEYFCPSVESLSRVLRLSPTIAGTTLLPLGNGANDVFSSVISFTRSGDADVGLSSVLGGAFFISCFVVGVVSIAVSSRGVRVDKASFVRDVLFFLFVLCCVIMMNIFERINFWFALCFFCIYFLYIALVSVMQFLRRKEATVRHSQVLDDFGDVEVPLLEYADEEKASVSEKSENLRESRCCRYLNLFLFVLELPLSLPRRLTIPDVSEEKWSKPFAVSSATLAPVLIGALCIVQQESIDSRTSFSLLIASIVIGISLGAAALVFTKSSGPPKRWLLAWLAGCFLMSITWTYIIVQELVSLLVAFGNILGISPSILGLTVLAWGNSLGDLISNLAMALKGGADGAQVAISGCYAGPLFNTLVGLGFSLVLASFKVYPAGYAVPKDSDVYETVGFLMGGLLWALVILPKRNMQLDKSLGIGLLAIYFCFLFLRIVKGLGILQLGG